MKRLIFGVGASLAVGMLTASGAFASSLDYANSIGQVDMGDTINYVIEATSDGGYVAGGQTIQCFKNNKPKEVLESFSGNLKHTMRLAAGDAYFGEVVPMAECEEYYADSGDVSGHLDSEPTSYRNKVDSPIVRQVAVKTAETSGPALSIDNFCGGGGAAAYPSEDVNVYGAASSLMLSTVRLADYDPDAYYLARCVDYIAKFKKDGTKEWLTTIMDDVIPVAVGETTNDYRLLTKRGTLYTFAKTNGDEGLSSSIAANIVRDAIINNDGTTTASGYPNGIAIYNANGSLKKALPESSDENSYDGYYANDGTGAKGLVRTSDGGFLAMREQLTFDENGDVVDGTLSIVKVSSDLNTVVPIVEIPVEDLDEASIDSITILSSDQDGNTMLGLDVYDSDSDEDSYFVATINKDGDMIEMKELSEVAGYDENDDDLWPLFLDDFTVADPVNQKLVRLSPELKEIDSYSMGDGEMIYDVVVLNDKSMAGVGRASASTANYTVDGGMNGIYLRLAAKKGGNGTVNPNTGDDSFVYIAAGTAAIVLVAGAVAVLGKRR